MKLVQGTMRSFVSSSTGSVTLLYAPPSEQNVPYVHNKSYKNNYSKRQLKKKYFTTSLCTAAKSNLCQKAQNCMFLRGSHQHTQHTLVKNNKYTTGSIDVS